MSDLEQARRKFKIKLKEKQNTSDAIAALLGLGNGTVSVPTQPGYVYIRVGNEENYGTAYNDRVPNTDNLPIFVGYDPVIDPERRLFQVLSIRQSSYVGSGSTPIPTIGPHHTTHEFGGGDDVYVAWRRLMGLRVGRPVLFVLTVDPGYIYRAPIWIAAPVGANTVDLTAQHALLVGSQAQWVLISLDPTGAISVLPVGTIKASPALLLISDIPTPPAGNIPLAAVKIYKTQTAIGDTPSAPDIVDLRFPTYAAMNNGGVAGLDTDIQYNDGGVFGADSNFDWLKTEQRLEIGGPRPFVFGPDTTHGLNIISDTGTPCAVFWGIGATWIPAVKGYRARGTIGAYTAPLLNDNLFAVDAAGWSGVAATPAAPWTGSAAKIRLIANEDWTDTANGTRIEISTTPSGSDDTAIAIVATFDNASGIKNNATDLYTTANYILTAEITGAVIVRSAIPNIVGGAFGAMPGNARGAGAVDLQLARTSADEVASGTGSFASGSSNKNTAYFGTTIGYKNRAEGNYAIAIGIENYARGAYSMAYGYNAVTATAVSGGTAHAGSFAYGYIGTWFYTIVGGEFAVGVPGGFRVAYDNSNYARMIVASDGVTTFSTLPVGAGFIFTPPITFTAAPIVSTLTTGRVVFAGASKELVDDADLTFSGTRLTATDLTVTNAPIISSLTATRVVFAGASKELVDSSTLTYSPTAATGLSIVRTIADPAAAQYNYSNTLIATLTQNNAQLISATVNDARVSGAFTHSGNVYGDNTNVRALSGVTISGIAAPIRGIMVVDGTSTAADVRTLYAQGPSITAGGIITTAYGLYIAAHQVTGVGTGYGVYQAGTSDLNYFGGIVGIKMTPVYTLDVTGNFRCSTGFGCNAALPQTAYASGGALAAYVTGAFGLNSDANMSALHAMIVKIRAALVANGIMS